MVVLNTNYCIYLSFSEGALLSCTLVRETNDNLCACETTLHRDASPLVSWAYSKPIALPNFISADCKKIVRSRLTFWMMVNDYVDALGLLLNVSAINEISDGIAILFSQLVSLP